jgi:hypothetical protein
MTGRAAALQGGLAVLGLFVANMTWQREPERAPGEVEIFDAGKNDVSRVHYEDDATALDLERRKDDAGPAVWLHVVDKGPAKPPVKVEGKTLPKPVTTLPKPPRDLRGGEAAEKLLEQLTPFRSPRAFGVLDDAKIKELGLDAPKRKLTVTVRGDAREFDIGQPPGSTTGEAFLRDKRDGRVYLMPRGMASDLQVGATRLVERKLHHFEANDADRIVVAVGDKKRELVQTHRENPHAAQLASAKTPDKPDQTAKNWHDMIWRLAPTDVLGRDEAPAEGTPVPFARVDYFDGKKPLGWIEIAKAPAPAVQESTAAPPAPALYARTEHTAGWVKLRPNPQLGTDTEKVVSTQ